MRWLAKLVTAGWGAAEPIHKQSRLGTDMSTPVHRLRGVMQRQQNHWRL